MFLKPFNKLAVRVLSGLKPLGFASGLNTPIKHSRSFIKNICSDDARISTPIICRLGMQLFLWLNVYFAKTTDRIFYGFTGVINPLEILGDHEKRSKITSRLRVIYRLFEYLQAFLLFSQHPSGFLTQVNP